MLTSDANAQNPTKPCLQVYETCVRCYGNIMQPWRLLRLWQLQVLVLHLYSAFCHAEGCSPDMHLYLRTDRHQGHVLVAQAPAGSNTGLHSICSCSGGLLDLASFGLLLLNTSRTSCVNAARPPNCCHSSCVAHIGSVTFVFRQLSLPMC